LTLKRAISKKNNENVVDPLKLKPKLRPYIEAVSAQSHEGKDLFGLKDNLEISPDILWMEPELFYLMQFFDGHHSADEIRAKFLHRNGDFLFEQDYLDLVSRLDANLLFDNKRFHEQHFFAVDRFRAHGVRPLACYGGSYPKDAEKCAQFFNKEFEKLPKSKEIDVSNKHIKAIILPHIDIRLGISSYLKGYQLLREAKPSDLYIILGTGHLGLTNLFALSALDFETPFGPAMVDKEFLQKLVTNSSADFFKDELIHKTEHSIEFQTVLLKYFINNNFRILPVLTSFPFSIFEQTQSASGAIYTQFTDRLKKLIDLYKGNVTIIASVDFSHIGERYGDQHGLDNSLLAQMEYNDRELLNSLVKFDQTSFQKKISQTENRYRICGYSSLTTLQDIMQPTEGFLVDYESVTMKPKSTVSFATMVFV
jgi:MEMO1 family protein